MTSFQEVEEHYTLDDLLNMNEALDGWQAAKAAAQAAAQKKG